MIPFLEKSKIVVSENGWIFIIAFHVVPSIDSVYCAKGSARRDDHKRYQTNSFE